MNVACRETDGYSQAKHSLIPLLTGYTPPYVCVCDDNLTFLNGAFFREA